MKTKLSKKINLRQPKYMIPALVYIPLLVTGYFLIDLFHTGKADFGDPSMQTTEYLNPNLPEARVKDDLGSKLENMLRSYGRIDDFSAVGNIDRDEDDPSREEYESKYTDEELQALSGQDAARETGAQERDREMEARLAQSAERAAAMRSAGGYPFPLTESEQLIQSRQREEALREELGQALAQIREQAATQASAPSPSSPAQAQSPRAVTAPDGEEAAQVVRRIRRSSDYFHTVSGDEAPPDLVKAIIDEDIRAVDGSRVRLRLLDDVEIGNLYMPGGSYLYAVMSGFSSQRVKGSVKSVLLDGGIVRVSLSLYDTDGLEGLYVPSSSFRETARDVAAGAAGTSVSLNQGSYGDALSQWGMQAVQNAYQRTASAVGKAIRRNSAVLKYGTFVYLVNARDIRNE